MRPTSGPPTFDAAIGALAAVLACGCGSGASPLKPGDSGPDSSHDGGTGGGGGGNDGARGGGGAGGDDGGAAAEVGGGDAPEPIGAGWPAVWDFAVSGDMLYWFALEQAPSGFFRSQIATPPPDSDPLIESAVGVVVSGPAPDAFATLDGSPPGIYRVGPTGAPVVVVTLTSRPCGLGIDLAAGALYYGDSGAGQIWTSGLDGSNATVLTTLDHGDGGAALDLPCNVSAPIAVFAQEVGWISSSGTKVFWAPRSGGPTTSTELGFTATDLVAAGETAYVLGQNGLTSRLVSVSVADKSVVPIRDSIANENFTALAADATELFVGVTNGYTTYRIEARDLGTGAVRVVVNTGRSSINDLEVDANYIYWGDTDLPGKIFRLSRSRP